MPVSWTAHRFSGGALALDVANTVVLRDDPARRFDRFDDPAEIARFAQAAGVCRAAELKGRTLAACDPEAIRPLVLAIREALDRLLRSFVRTGALGVGPLAELLRGCEQALAPHAQARVTEKGFLGDGETTPFEAALALSALSLLPPERLRSLRICGHCGWLFLDRSRNGSRLWCDMAVCGNREKARRHQTRRKFAAGGSDR